MNATSLKAADGVAARTAVCVAALMLVHGVALADPAARVVFAAGEVRVLAANGTSRAAARDLAVDSGDTIETGKGQVQLRMVDGAMMSLGERTTLRLDDYRPAGPAGDDEHGYMSLLKGALRTISGSIGKARPERYKLETPSGTIGIRGTEYTADTGDGLRVGVIGGLVAVCNDGGCVDVPKGSSAYTPNRSVKPGVSVRVSMIVPPTEGSAHSVDGAVPTSEATPVAGDRITRSFVAAASNGGSPEVDVEDSLPLLGGPSAQGAQGPAPAPPPGAAPLPAPAPAPGAAPSPAPAPAPGPAPAPSPAPAPAPAPSSGSGSGSSSGSGWVQVPLANGDGPVGLVWRTDKGEAGSGLTEGTRKFDKNSGLENLDALGKGGKKLLEKGKTVDPGADGIVAWGRWIDGESKVKDASGDGKGKIATLHYFAFAGQPSLPVTGSFASFASTAPTATVGGNVVATGNLNAAGGTVSVAFPSASGGTASYSLTVPVAGQSFSLTGQATQFATFGFAGVSDIRSTGTGCNGGCTGSLGNDISVRGLVGGSAGNRIGLTYGFDSRIGNVSGVIVFKP